MQKLNSPARNPRVGNKLPVLFVKKHICMHNLPFHKIFVEGLDFFYNGFPSIGKFWSHGCLGFHWLSIKLKIGCPVSLSFERCFIGRYFQVVLVLLVDYVNGFRLELIYVSLINISLNLMSMSFSCLCCCQSSYKSLFCFAPTE